MSQPADLPRDGAHLTGPALHDRLVRTWSRRPAWSAGWRRSITRRSAGAT